MRTQATITASLLNFRAAPGGRILTALPEGTRLEVLERRGRWLHVEGPGRLTGYVSARYVRMQPERDPEPRQDTGIVTASRLNLRAAPGGTVLDTLPRDTAVRILASEGGWLQVQAGRRIGYVSGRYVSRQPEVTPAATAPGEDVSGYRLEGSRALAPDGTVFAQRFRKGVYSRGETTIAAFLAGEAGRFADMPPSALRVLSAVSENEGRFEAINTWDNAYLSFGIFQWTAGVRGSPGELAALLQRLQAEHPGAFDAHFGRHGLVPWVAPARPGSAPRGHLVLRGQTLASGEAKERLRALHWAHRFWAAGHDDRVRETQVRHALARIDLFYRAPNRRMRGRFVGDYVTSEYGVALLLDQHVNRPGHVPLVLANALESLAGALPIDAPEGWQDAEEDALLERYLALRADTSMTHSAARARRVWQRVEQQALSAARGSFAWPA